WAISRPSIELDSVVLDYMAAIWNGQRESHRQAQLARTLQRQIAITTQESDSAFAQVVVLKVELEELEKEEMQLERLCAAMAGVPAVQGRAEIETFLCANTPSNKELLLPVKRALKQTVSANTDV
ncbi:hypothetical protein HDU93_001808, partial [Gonapodya sp. JEL0774]